MSAALMHDHINASDPFQAPQLRPSCGYDRPASTIFRVLDRYAVLLASGQPRWWASSFAEETVPAV